MSPPRTQDPSTGSKMPGRYLPLQSTTSQKFKAARGKEESATRVGYGSDLFKLAGRAHVRSPTVYVAKPSSGYLQLSVGNLPSHTMTGTKSSNSPRRTTSPNTNLRQMLSNVLQAEDTTFPSTHQSTTEQSRDDSEQISLLQSIISEIKEKVREMELELVQLREEKDRFSLYDDTSSSVFTVTIRDLREEDSGTYHCGVDITTKKDSYTEVNLKVLTATLSASLDSEEAAAVETSDQHAEDISLRKPAVFAAFSLPCLLRYPADYILLCSVLCVFVCLPCDTLHLKEREALLQMPRSSCGSCRAPLSDSDRHVICALCLGLDRSPSREPRYLLLPPTSRRAAAGFRPHCRLLRG
ncbi:unnamed protein product [Leuciscus chuanchicus]